MPSKPFVIVEVIYQNFTQLDFTGPHTIFSRLPETRVVVASRDGGEVESDGALFFARTTPLAEVEHCDLMFIPGGVAATDVINDLAFMAEVRRLGREASYLTSVCTGSLVLAATGLIKGRRAACHWAWRELLPLFGVEVDERRVARDGNLITGGGVTAGIDFALVVAAELRGEEFAQGLQLGIEYAPEPPFNAGRPETAPHEVLASVKARLDAMASSRRAGAEAAAARIS